MDFGDLPLSPNIPDLLAFSGQAMLVTLGDRASTRI